jgi:hypothetical protein
MQPLQRFGEFANGISWRSLMLMTSRGKSWDKDFPSITSQIRYHLDPIG